MTKKLMLVVSFMLCFSLVFFGCKSKPEDEKAESPVEEVGSAPLSKEQLALREIEAAKKARALIEENKFQPYDQASYDDGVKAIEEYDGLFAEKAPIDKQLDAAKRARASLQKVLDNAYMDLASKKKAEVDKVRKAALAIKSDKASKDNYASAQSKYTSGQEAFERKAYLASYDSYCKALTEFTDLYNEVSEKRAAAEKAIAQAKEMNAKVDEFAAQADQIAPLTDEPVVQKESAEPKAQAKEAE